MAITIRPGESEPAPIDDYQIDRGVGEAMRPVAHQVLNVFNAVLLIVVAAVSFALFWVVGTLLGVV